MRNSCTIACFPPFAAGSSSKQKFRTPGLFLTLAFAVSALTPSTWGQRAATFTRLYAFSALSLDMDGNLDGALPQDALIQGRDGNFYGTTSTASGELDDGPAEGTVFKVTPGGALTTLYSFSGGTDGASPSASLLECSDGNFYGTTSGAGGSTFNDPGAGTVFQITPGGVLTTLYRFGTLDSNQANQDGGDPTCNLIRDAAGNFYGTTQQGGSGASGTVFRLTPGGVLTTLHTFSATDGDHVNADGARPIAGLAKGSDGNFYGTTFYGGPGGYGTVFQITPVGTFTTLHSFSLSDGEHPYAGLVQGSDGNFYGTTDEGGANGRGTVFQITPAGVLTSLHSFDGHDGKYPYAGLFQGSNGSFYGTTLRGGKNNFGTVFQMTPAGILTTVHSFSGRYNEESNYVDANSDGAFPVAAVIRGGDGNLYGLASGGGPGGTGTIFRVAPTGVLAITSSASATVLAGHRFRYQLTATGLPTVLTASELPTGLSYDAATGVISGVVPKAGTFSIALSASNAGGTVTEVLALNVMDLPVVTLTTETPTVRIGSGGIGEFLIRLSAAQTRDVVVNLTLEGTAINGTDYELLKTTKEIPAGRTIKSVVIRPLGNLGGAAQKTIKLAVEPGIGYRVDAGSTAKLTIIH